MRTGILIALFFASSLASAQAGEIYRIDPARSTIAFSVHQLLNVTHGKFSRFAGTIDVDRAHPENSSVEATIEVASVDTGIAKRDEHLRSADFFDAAKFPRISFKSRRVIRTGPEAGEITGDLAMHGVTRPIALRVKLASPLPVAGAGTPTRWEVRTDPIRRNDYGLRFSNTAETVSGIGQAVTIEIRIEATKS